MTNLEKEFCRLFISLVGLVVTIAQGSLCQADSEAANRMYVTASEYGQFYAKSIPHESYGLKGITNVYQVAEEDILLQTYDWYSPQIFLEGFAGNHTVYVVQMGPWHRGHQASQDHHAIAFYKNDKLLKKYSTLNIVEVEGHVSPSVSHYTVFDEISGFRRPFGNQLVFDVKTHDGRRLSFDADTGSLLTKEEERIKHQLYDTQVKIGQIKWKWYETHRDTIENIDKVLITEEELQVFASEDYPQVPNGYRYMPDTIWSPVRIERVPNKNNSNLD